MIEFLVGVPGKLKTLVDRLSSTWAAQLDTLAARLSATWAAKLDTLAADYTTAKAAYLDGAISTRAKEDTPILDIPIASGVVPEAPGVLIGGGSGRTFDVAMGLKAAGPSAGVTLVTAYSYTGAGVLEFCAEQHGIGAVYGSQLVITIDGAIVFDFTTSSFGAYHAFVAVGAANVVREWNGTSFESRYVISSLAAIPFKTSLLIQHRVTNASENTTTYFKLRKTG